MKNSISLIGMAGAGKSSIAKELKKVLDFEIIDSDLLIEQQQKKSLQSILDDYGYIKLREIEERILLKVNFNKIILSTGGSAVYSQRAMEYLMQNSMVLFLDVPFHIIAERVDDFSGRGFAKLPSQTIYEAFQERESLYKNYSHHVIDNSSDIEACMSKIFELLKINY